MEQIVFFGWFWRGWRDLGWGRAVAATEKEDGFGFRGGFCLGGFCLGGFCLGGFLGFLGGVFLLCFPFFLDCFDVLELVGGADGL